MSGLRSPFARMRGLGSAKEGSAHWWAQRVTALALAPLTLWFVFGLVARLGAPPGDVTLWVADPTVTVLLIALLVATFHHAQLGLQVVIEDYVHREATKLALLLAVKAACWLLCAAGVLAVVRIAFIVQAVDVFGRG